MKIIKQHAIFLSVLATLILLLAFTLAADAQLTAQPPLNIVYLKPSNIQTPSQGDIDSLRDVIVQVQAFYASEMARHGYGEKTFDFDADIKIVEGNLTAEQYVDMDTVKNEVHQLDFDVQNKIDVVFLAGRKRILGGALGGMLPICWQWPGSARDVNDCNYLVAIPTGYQEFLLPVTAHEIGHAFGLQHTSNQTTNDRIDLMYDKPTFYEGIKAELEDFAFNREDATFLNNTGRLSIQENPEIEDTEIVIDTDVNDDGYTDLYDCLIVRSGMSAETSYDTDINNDGVTNILDLMLVKAAAFEAIAAAAPSKQRVKITTWGAIKKR